MNDVILRRIQRLEERCMEQRNPVVILFEDERGMHTSEGKPYIRRSDERRTVIIIDV